MKWAVPETKSLTEVLNPLDASHPTGDNGTSLIHWKPIPTFYSAHSNIIHLHNNGRLRQSLQKTSFLQKCYGQTHHPMEFVIRDFWGTIFKILNNWSTEQNSEKTGSIVKRASCQIIGAKQLRLR